MNSIIDFSANENVKDNLFPSLLLNPIVFLIVSNKIEEFML